MPATDPHRPIQTDAGEPKPIGEIDWYFDFLSPFAYFQHELLLRRHPQLQRNYRPVLLAGLLKHWENKGPAEIPAKRLLTYQYCQWFAGKHGIDLKFPPAHPFNPLPALRLAIAQDCGENCITAIFRAIYAAGADLGQQQHWEELCRQLKIPDGADRIRQQWVKDRLRANTEQAAQKSVFGVPTVVIGGRHFWGVDMTDMALEYRSDPGRFSRGEYHRLASLPVGQARKI